MRSFKRAALIVALVSLGAAFSAPDVQGATPGPCTSGVLPSGALSLICIPVAGWNGNVIIFAHGYVAFNEPLDFYHLDLPDGTNIPMLVQKLGFAFATTSYRQNGLAILEGIDDIRELVAAVNQSSPPPGRAYITGVSEGGLVAALIAERSPEQFTGALSTCGPIGSFRRQIDYIGDFRVLFDYYYPGLIPGEAIHIPPTVIRNWEAQHVPAITASVQADPVKAAELLRVAHVAFDPADTASFSSTTINLLWYSVFATDDAFKKLGGNPFSNATRWYSGSSDDAALNAHVHRFNTSKNALAAVQNYETSGQLRIPMVTLHTVGDEIIPFMHESLYRKKVQLSERGQFIAIPVSRYGHCNFDKGDVLSALVALLAQP